MAVQISADLSAAPFLALLPREAIPPLRSLNGAALAASLSDIERHVLGRVAAHAWMHEGRIPFVAPTPHQRAIAERLACPEHGLVQASSWSTRRARFQLTRLGERVARHALHVVAAADDIAWEVEFDRMQALMRNDWETGASESDDMPDPPRLLL